MKVSMHTHTRIRKHTVGGCNLFSHCSLYSESCKTQLYAVTWDHLQEMKSITKEKKKKERAAKGEYFEHEGGRKFSSTIQTWEAETIYLNSLQVEGKHPGFWMTHRKTLCIFSLALTATDTGGRWGSVSERCSRKTSTNACKWWHAKQLTVITT